MLGKGKRGLGGGKRRRESLKKFRVFAQIDNLTLNFGQFSTFLETVCKNQPAPLSSRKPLYRKATSRIFFERKIETVFYLLEENAEFKGKPLLAKMNYIGHK